MEIKRLNDNQIRCALTEEEIEEMGFCIDDIIGNTEITQKFMHVVLNRVEELGQIDIQNISPMVRAELLQDHSMAITFGGDSDSNFRNLVDTVNQLMSQMKPEKRQEFHNMNEDEKQNMLDEFIKGLEGGLRKKEQEADGSSTEKAEASEAPEAAGADAEELFRMSMPFGLEFSRLDDIIRMSRLFQETERIPQSSLYKLNGQYYLMMDFITFSKEELRPLAFAAVEYDKAHFSDPGHVAFIKEHGKCIMKNEALQTLMQL